MTHSLRSTPTLTLYSHALPPPPRRLSWGRLSSHVSPRAWLRASHSVSRTLFLWRDSPAAPRSWHSGLCAGVSDCLSLLLFLRVNFSHLAKRLLQVFQEECVQKYQASLVTHGNRMR